MTKTVDFAFPQELYRKVEQGNPPFHEIQRLGRITIAGFVDMEFRLENNPVQPRAWPAPLLLIDSQLAYPPRESRQGTFKSYFTYGKRLEAEQGILLEPNVLSEVDIPDDHTLSPSVYLGSFMDPAEVDAYLFKQPIAYDEQEFAEAVAHSLSAKA